MFQSLVSFVAVILSVLLFSCSKTSDQAGIEIGNPEIQAHSFLARFVVDYELEETDSPEPAVAARMALDSDSVLIDDLSLSLWRLSAYSSYYIWLRDLLCGPSIRRMLQCPLRLQKIPQKFGKTGRPRLAILKLTNPVC